MTGMQEEKKSEVKLGKDLKVQQNYKLELGKFAFHEQFITKLASTIV